MAVSPISGGTLDVQSIVSQLMQVESQPLTKMKQDIGSVQSKVSVWGKLQSTVSAFKDAATKLTQAETWKASTAKSADETSVGVTSGADAAGGRYSVSVTSLAQSQTVATAAFAATDSVVGGGTLTIQLGAVDDASAAFTPDAQRTATINVPAGTTLAQLRDRINNSAAGISASLVNDGSGFRLVMNGSQTGQKNAFQVSATEDGSAVGGAGLSALAASATAASGGNGTVRTQTSADARLSINGLDIRSQSNKVEDAIQGVKLDLKKVGAQPVEIDVSTDTDALKTNVEKFVSTYNDLANLLKTNTAYDATTKKGGPLQGNAIAVRMQAQMREALRTVSGFDGMETLSKVGIAITRDGTLSTDATKLQSALASPEKLKAMFAGAPTGATGVAAGAVAKGVAGAFSTAMGVFLDTNGPIQGATDSLRARQRALEQKQSDFETKLTSREAALTKQYSALNANIQKIQQAYAGVASLLG